MHNLVRCSIAAALAMVVSTASVSAETPHPTFTDETEQYAKDMNVSLGEAAYRLDLQTGIGKLNAELETNEADTFAGLWIEHEPEYHIVVQFTKNGEQTIRPYIENTALAEVVKVQTADITYQDLEATQLAILETFDKRGIVADSDIDVKTSRVQMLVTEETSNKAMDVMSEAKTDLMEKSAVATDQVEMTSEAELLDTVDIITVDTLSEPTNYAFGGASLTDCTSGFVVQNASGVRGISTAGHCRDDQVYFNQNLQYVAGSDSGSADAQWHYAPSGFLTESWINISKGYDQWVRIRGAVYRDQQAIGTYVCKYGKTTGVTCGTIQAKNAKPGYIKNGLNTFIRVKATDPSVVMTEGGDSGGPYWSGEFAYGTQTGKGFFFPDEALYMAVDYFGDIGVSVAVDP
ncbi:MAG: hypothetical protein GFH27_549347n66 [Chloroflexi bacterium AL-W]|nr:hypothetical protein [Chloroflexi bacterium AL-N1]NOK70848.1 hypothetical protein [Chloroflexi bacterium AL-N10]NOK78408.1 hypothetical protein [Chloroflexi bacterium AL-N5]NOK85389.1 hypothetical protein [Chloroflexi bacterium AL-W]NOK92665.1 hypothetical protein [Chloroflexi bacterium AL-N15]